MLGYPDPHPASQPRIPIPQVLAAPGAHQFALGDGQVSQHSIHDAVGHSGCDGQFDFTGSGERGVKASTHSPCKPWGQPPQGEPCWGDGCSAVAPREAPRTCPGLWRARCMLPEQEQEQGLAGMEDAECIPSLMVGAPLCQPRGTSPHGTSQLPRDTSEPDPSGKQSHSWKNTAAGPSTPPQRGEGSSW